MGQLDVGFVLVIVGSWLASPPIVLLGLVLVIGEGIRRLWARRGLRGLEYTRTLARLRGVVGDPIPLTITVWNRSALPLAWLRADDEASPGVIVRERDLVGTDAGRALGNAWTLAPFERVTRHFNILAERRGVYSFGPVVLRVGDPFAREAAGATFPQVDRWLVHPRTVALAVTGRDDPWGGERRARHGLVDDPTRYAGVRPYQPGDPLRWIHWRASARLGTPVSRIFEPGRHREVVVVVDLQTVDGPARAVGYDDDAVESLCVAAASLVRGLRTDGAAVGLAAPDYVGAGRPIAFVPPGASNGQVGRCLDLLARLGPFPSVPVEQLLTTLLRSIRPGTSIIVIGARDPAPFVPALRRLGACGHRVQFIALGAGGSKAAARARMGGIDARTARLDGPWRTATTLVVA